MSALHPDLLPTVTKGAVPVRFVGPDEALDGTVQGWAEANGFKGKPGQVLPVPDGRGGFALVLVGSGETFDPMSARALPARLPPGLYRLGPPARPPSPSCWGPMCSTATRPGRSGTG